MDRVILDEVLRSKLRNLNGELEICDETGNTIGHFLPVDIYQRFLYATAQPPISYEEAANRMKTPGGRSLREILVDLESR
jgi:hypothetical protein